MKFTDAERHKVGWARVRNVRCPFCGSEPRRRCVRVDRRSREHYQTWDYHAARYDAALFAEMFIIKEELDIRDVVPV